MRSLAILALCTVLPLQAQTPSAPQFEVASIKPCKADLGSSSGIRTRPGRLDAYNVTLKRCIIGAYSLGPHQVLGGPEWLDSARFEIAAKADQPTDDDAKLMLMLQGLLADRFKLVVHRETREMSALVLEIARNGPKLEKSAGGESVTNTSSGNTGVTIEVRNTSMDAFAQILSRKMDLPVVDHTGLDGVFNFKLSWTPDTAKPSDTAGPSIFTAVQEQLGLRLHSMKTAVEILVIDHAEKPSAN